MNTTRIFTTPAMNTTRIFTTPAAITAVVALYTGTGKLKGARSMDFIARKYGTTIPAVRRALATNGVAIRGRGRVAQNA